MPDRSVGVACVGHGPPGTNPEGNVTPSNLEPRRCRRLRRASPHLRLSRCSACLSADPLTEVRRAVDVALRGRFWPRRSAARSEVRRLPRGAWSPKARGRSRDTQQESDGAFHGVRFLSAESAQVIQCAGLPHRHGPLSAFLTLSAVFSHLGLVALFHATSTPRISVFRALIHSTSRDASRRPLLSCRWGQLRPTRVTPNGSMPPFFPEALDPHLDTGPQPHLVSCATP